MAEPLSPFLRVLLDVARAIAERQAREKAARRGTMTVVAGGKDRAA